MKTSALIIPPSFLLFLLLISPFASAQNYLGSCTHIILENSSLIATCASHDGLFNDTSINLDDLISNENGILAWNDLGGFSSSCKNYILDSFRYLGADCGEPCHYWNINSCTNTSKIDLSEKLYNDNGRLAHRDINSHQTTSNENFP